MKTTLLAFLALTSVASADIVVRVTDGRSPVENAQVVAILKSGAYQEAKLEQGVYVCRPTEQCVKIFTGAPGFEGVVTKYSGANGNVDVALKSSPGKNSAVLLGRGTLPGIDGDIQPHLDVKSRTYMHGIKIGFEENGRPAKQPVFFNLKRPVDAVSPTGSKFKIWVMDITPTVSLVEFSLPK